MRFGPASIPRLEQTTLDGQVLLFTAAVSVAVGILFGLAPALQGARTSAQSALKEAGTRVSMGAGGRRARQVLVVGQLALAVLAQAPSPFMMLVVRTQGDPSGVVPAVRAQIARMDPEQSVVGFQTMEELLEKSGSRRRFQTALVAAFAFLALLLAAIGIYGVIAHGVAQRNREIGVRLALGARPRDVVALVLRNGMALIAAGTILGLLGEVALARTLASLLFAVSPFDPATYGSVAGVLALVAGVSAYIPSRGAAKVDPLVALRDE